MLVENKALEMKDKKTPSSPLATAFVSLLPFFSLPWLGSLFLFVSFVLSSSVFPLPPIASLFFPPHPHLFCSLQRKGRNQIPLRLGLASSN